MPRNSDIRKSGTGRGAFTLIEIAISVMLVTLAVVTVFMVLPSGIRVQNQVRYKVIAAAKAMELLELMRSSLPGQVNDARDMDKEGVFPWDTRITYGSMAPDLENYIASTRGAIRPLPEAIAYRLDSDDDEIRSLLDAGGQLYYFMPSVPTGALDSDKQVPADANWMSHGRKLLVGVVGAAQQNAILYHPSVKAGPYQDFYPTPPTHGREKIREKATDTRNGGVTNGIDYDALCRDPEIAEVFLSTDTYNATIQDDGGATTTWTKEPFGYYPLAKEIGVGGDGPLVLASDEPAAAGAKGKLRFEACKRRAEAYVVAALWYAGRTSLNQAELLALSPGGVEAFAEAHSAAGDWRQVLAMRYLAHAATCLTRYYPCGFPAAGAPIAGDPAANLIMGGADFSGVAVSLDHIRAWHEASIRMAVRHADKAGPYHWGASRPLNRQVMMDHPLVQLDLWSAPISGTFPFQTVGDFPPQVQGGKVTRRQWRALFPQAITQPGLPFMYPGRCRDTNGDGTVDPRDPAQSKAPFDYPARVLDTNGDGVLDDRDRPVPTPAVTTTVTPVLGDPALATLAADFQANGQAAVGPAANFNLTAPFQPAQRCRQLVFWAVDWQAYDDAESQPSEPVEFSASGVSAKQTDQGPHLPIQGVSPLSRSGNPEGGLCWLNPARDATLNNPVKGRITSGRTDAYNDAMMSGASFQGIPIDTTRYNLPHAFLGIWGADRNGDGIWTRGPVPPVARLRAVEVGRYVAYDPVLWVGVRQ